MEEEVEFEGIKLALSKLDLKAGNLIVVRGDISPSEANRFRRLLLDRIPLDVTIPGIVILAPDQAIAVHHVESGDVVKIVGDFPPSQVQAFRKDLETKVPGSSVVALRPGEIMTVKTKSIRETEGDDNSCGEGPNSCA